MTWLFFLVTALTIVYAGVWLARMGDAIAEKTGLGRSWIGLVLVAATTSLPELFTGVGATTVFPAPDIAIGDVLGSCMFNLLILSMMDAIGAEPLSTRAHQGHALAIGFGMLLVAIAGLGLVAGPRMPHIGWVGVTAPTLIVLYLLAMRMAYSHERRRNGTSPEADTHRHLDISLRAAVVRYAGAAVAVVAAAIWLPKLGADIAEQTGLGQAFVGSLLVAITTSLPEIVVSLAAVRLGAVELGISNVLGSNLFNLLILGVDDVLYRQAPILSVADPSHAVSVLALIGMNAMFLIGLTYQVMRKRFLVAWDTAGIAAIYVAAVLLAFLARDTPPPL